MQWNVRPNMNVSRRNLSRAFKAFFDSEKSSGILLLICAAVSPLVTNSANGAADAGLGHAYLGPLSVNS